MAFSNMFPAPAHFQTPPGYYSQLAGVATAGIPAGGGGLMAGIGNWLKDPNAQYALASMGQAVSPPGSMMQGVATNLMPMMQSMAQMQAMDKAQKMWQKYFTDLFGPPKPPSGPAPMQPTPGQPQIPQAPNQQQPNSPLIQALQQYMGQGVQPTTSPTAMQPQPATTAEQALGATPGQVLAGGGGQGTFPFL